MSEITTTKMVDGTYRLDYINGEWATVYGLTKEQAYYWKKNFDYFKIAKKFKWE